MSRRDNIRRAKEILAERRSGSIAAYEKHVAEVSDRIPEFDRVSRELSATGARILASSIGHDGASIEEIRTEYNSLVQRKKALLREHGYPETYCDIQYSCKRCSDTGYIGIEQCDCLRKEIILASLETSGLYRLVEEQRFDTFSLAYYSGEDRVQMQQNAKILYDFAESFEAGKSDSYLFIGATGLGKTHLSSAVARRIIEKGAYVVYEPALKLFGDYEARRFGANRYDSETDDDLERYLDCDLLIIDDLGCEMTNQFTVSCLYNLINSRMIRHQSTIINTNLTQSELQKRYSDRIVSRLFGEYKPLIFRGKDIREQKLLRNR